MSKLITACFLSLFLPTLLYCQDKISLDCHNQPLVETLQQLEQVHQLTFSFSGDLPQINISVSFKDLELPKALERIFKSTSIEYEIINDKYIILKVEEPFSDNTSSKPRFQVINLCGKILDEETETPLPYSNIFVTSKGSGTNANEEGEFSLKGAFNPSTNVEISFIGYEKKTLTVAQLSTCPTIFLKLEDFSFEEVIIKEYITEGIEQSPELDHMVLNPDRIDVLPGLTEADVLQMVQILPGVQSPDESASGLHIRGGTPDQNLILWDGIPIYSSGHFFGMISAFNPYIVDDVKVYRGGFGAKYGGRISGVIDISSENSIPQKSEGSVGINFTHADISTTLPFANRKAALTLSARRAYTNIIESPTYKKLSDRVFQKGKIEELQNDEEELNSTLDFVFNDLNAKLLLQPDQNNTIALSAFGIFDNLNFSHSFDGEDSTELESDDVNSKSTGYSAIWNRKWHSAFNSELRFIYTEFDDKYRLDFNPDFNGSESYTRLQSNLIKDLSISFNNEIKLGRSSGLNLGYQFTNLEVHRSLTFIETFLDDDDEEFSDVEVEAIIDKSYLHHLHLTYDQEIASKFLIRAGLRYSYFQQTEESFLEPRVSLLFAPIKNWQLKASLGQYRQFVGQVIELNELGLNEQLWAMANEEEEIPITKSNHYSVGLAYTKPKFQFEIEAYSKEIFGITSVSPVFLNSTSGQFFDTGTGTARGIDFLIKKRWKNYQTWISYSLSEVEYNFEEYNNGQPFSAPHDRPHSLNFMHILNIKDFQISLNWKYGTGRVYTEENGFHAEEDVNDEGEEFTDLFVLYEGDAINAKRLPDYHRLDASLLYKIRPESQKYEALLGLSFLNIYNRRNILSRAFFVDVLNQEEVDDEGAEPIYAVDFLDRPLLRFTPNVVLRFSW